MSSPPRSHNTDKGKGKAKATVNRRVRTRRVVVDALDDEFVPMPTTSSLPPLAQPMPDAPPPPLPNEPPFVFMSTPGFHRAGPSTAGGSSSSVADEPQSETPQDNQDLHEEDSSDGYSPPEDFDHVEKIEFHRDGRMIIRPEGKG